MLHLFVEMTVRLEQNMNFTIQGYTYPFRADYLLPHSTPFFSTVRIFLKLLVTLSFLIFAFMST